MEKKVGLKTTNRNDYDASQIYGENRSPLSYYPLQPLFKDNPTRKLDAIEEIQITPCLCGHTCVAMLSGAPLSDIVAIMGKEPASWSKILETLDYYGITYGKKAVYTKGKEYKLPECCILNNDGFVLWYKESYYEVRDIDPKKTVSFLEVIC